MIVVMIVSAIVVIVIAVRAVIMMMMAKMMVMMPPTVMTIIAGHLCRIGSHVGNASKGELTPLRSDFRYSLGADIAATGSGEATLAIYDRPVSDRNSQKRYASSIA